jgi:hypothetical protein
VRRAATQPRPWAGEGRELPPTSQQTRRLLPTTQAQTTVACRRIRVGGGRIHARGGRIRAGRGLLRPELARNDRCRRVNAKPPTTPTPNPLEEGMGVAAAHTPSARLRRHRRSTGMGGAARARHWWSSPPWFARERAGSERDRKWWAAESGDEKIRSSRGR